MTQGATVEARQWVVKKFAPDNVWPTMTDEERTYYQNLIEKAIGLAVAEGTEQIELRHMIQAEKETAA